MHTLSNTKKYTAGYTLLFAVLTAALVLGVAVFILSVAKRQYALSVAARDSMYALYAADSGLECTVATDIATGTPSSPATIRIHCDGYDSTPATFALWATPDSDTWPTTYTGYTGSEVYRAYNMIIALPASTCAVISIAEGSYADGTVEKQKRVIESRGYNYCDAAGPKAGSRTVERALRLTYK